MARNHKLPWPYVVEPEESFRIAIESLIVDEATRKREMVLTVLQSYMIVHAADSFDDLVAEFYDDIYESRLVPQVEWPAEGDDSHKAMVAQLLQHLKSLLYLSTTGKVTVETVKRAHWIMFYGAKADFKAGELRTTDVSSDPGSSFSRGSKVLPDLLFVLQEIEEQRLKVAHTSWTVRSSVNKVASIFYRLLEVHPFPNGNGRICLLVLPVLMKMFRVVPLVLPLWDGSATRKKMRHHFFYCLKRAINKMDVSALSEFLYSSLIYNVYRVKKEQDAAAYGRAFKEYDRLQALLAQALSRFWTTECMRQINVALVQAWTMNNNYKQQRLFLPSNERIRPENVSSKSLYQRENLISSCSYRAKQKHLLVAREGQRLPQKITECTRIWRLFTKAVK